MHSGNYKWAGATTARKAQATPGADPLGKVWVTLPGKRLNRNCCWEWEKSRMSGTRRKEKDSSVDPPAVSVMQRLWPATTQKALQ